MNKKNTKALVPFLTCGDPSLDVTRDIILALDEVGTDCVLLGIPFSDPTAEAGIIQAAFARALSGGVTTDAIFDMVAEVRKKSDVQLAFETYANVVFTYGIEKFVKKMAENKVTALLLQDVPFEEKDEFSSVCEKYGIDWVQMACSTYAGADDYRRLGTIAKGTQGFLYCTEVSGMPDEGHRKLTDMLTRVRALTDVPCVLECPGSTNAEYKEFAAMADGILIGPQLVTICGEYGSDSIEKIKQTALEIIKAINA